MHTVARQLSEEQTNILLTVYALTGCDTCSAFFGIGKKKAFKIMLNNAEELQGLSDSGKDSSMSVKAKRHVSLLLDCYMAAMDAHL